MEGLTSLLPEFYRSRIERELGAMYEFLPAPALMHDPTAFLRSSATRARAAAVASG
jgi:hypothetical protein